MKYYGKELIKLNNLYVYYDIITNILGEPPTHSNNNSIRVLLKNFSNIMKTLPDELYSGAATDFEHLCHLCDEKERIVDVLKSLSYNDKLLVDNVYEIIDSMEDKDELKRINRPIGDNEDLKFIQDVLLGFPENIRKVIWKDIKFYKLHSSEPELVW